MNKSELQEIQEAYTAGNNAGDGFAPRQENVDDATDAYERRGWTVLHRAETTDELQSAEMAQGMAPGLST